MQTRAENSFGKFENDIFSTIKYGFVHGHTSVDQVISEDDGHLVIQNFWIVFLGSKGMERVHVAKHFVFPKQDLPFFAENEEEAVFNIEYITLSNDKHCNINIPDIRIFVAGAGCVSLWKKD